jgi:hypothetical protein
MTNSSGNAYEPGPGVVRGSGSGPGPVVPGGRHAVHSPVAQFIPTTGSEAAASAVRYNMTTWRVICGLCWAVWTALFAGGAIATVACGERPRLSGRDRLGRPGGLVRLPDLELLGPALDPVHHLLTTTREVTGLQHSPAAEDRMTAIRSSSHHLLANVD